MARTNTLSLSALETATMATLASRGSLSVSYGWSAHGEAQITTSMDAKAAMDLARSLPHFCPMYARKVESGSVVVGVMVYSK